MLEIRDLHAAYGRSAALHGVSLSVGPGEVVCLVGRNGVGKTSTLRAVVQELIQVTGGAVLLDGASLAGLPPHQVIRRGIGYVPEDRRVFASLTVAENLRVPVAPARGAAARWTLGAVYGLFPQLREYRGRVAGVMSGGEQQMLSIARSLLTNPRLLLLDEPHEGLAPRVVDEIIAALLALKREGVSMLISEQSVRTIKACADRVYVIDKGVTVYHGTPAEFEANPEVARRYLMVAEQEAEMFYHVVMMRYTDRANVEFHRRIEAFAERVRAECAGIVHYDYGANVAGRGKGYDWVIAGVFDSSAAHDAYQVSPPHQEMKAYMMPFIADLVVCDMDVPQPAPVAPARGGR